MKTILFFAVLMAVSGLSAEDVIVTSVEVDSKAALDGPKTISRDVCAIAYDIAIKELTESGWKKHKKNVEASYEQWSKDNPALSSRNNFLNATVLNLGLAAKDAEIKPLKQLVFWLALYNDTGFAANEELCPPSYTQAITIEQLAELESFAKKDKLDWQELSTKIKAKIAEYKQKEKEKEKKK